MKTSSCSQRVSGRCYAVESLESRVLLAVDLPAAGPAGPRVFNLSSLHQAGPIVIPVGDDPTGALPNLTPYQPSGWSDKTVVSNRTGTSTDDSPLRTTDMLYVDFATINNGTASTASRFYVDLYLDNVYQTSWYVDPPLGSYYYVYIQDFSLGSLSAGSHTVALYNDPDGYVAESSESDNNYVKTFNVVALNTAPTLSSLPDRTLDEDSTLGSLAPVPKSKNSQPEKPVGFDGDIQPLGDSTETGTRYRLFDQWGGAWSDAEKDNQAGDDLMCWAGAASNVLEWTGWGLTGGMSNTDQIFQYFQNHWTDAGSLARVGYEYWFNGTNEFAGASGWSQIDVSGGGNFYPTSNPDTYIYSRGQGTTANQYAMIDIDQYCRAGYGVALGLFGSLGHAITCWGFNYDSALSPTDRNYYKGIWITDSDDNKNVADHSTAPNILHYYTVAWDATNQRYSFSSYYSGAYIGEVDGLARQSINTFDLWNYAYDAETADSGLSFSITGNTNSACGVSISSNRYLRIAPTADWYGTSDVTITVSDGSLSASDTFRITVNSVNDPPVVSSISDSPDPVTKPNTFTLSAGASDSHDPAGSVSSVTFYRETNGTTGLQIGADTSVGTDTASGDGWSVSVSTSALAGGAYTYYAVATDNNSAVSAVGTSALTTINTVIGGDTTPPTVTAPGFNYLVGPHVFTFVFSENVSASLTASDLTLYNVTTSTTVPTASIAVSYNSGTNTATFSFPGFANGRLTDANWRATLPAGCVTDAAGNPLAAPCASNFFVLAGDANHDRIVDISDLGLLATNWQGTPRAFNQGDFNYDEKVDISDLGILATNWQRSIPAAGQPVGLRSPLALVARPAAIPFASRTPISLTRESDSLAQALIE